MRINIQRNIRRFEQRFKVCAFLTLYLVGNGHEKKSLLLMLPYTNINNNTYNSCKFTFTKEKKSERDIWN